MTHQKFNQLTRQQKRNTLLRFGAFISDRKLGPMRIMLYQLESFYVEVYFFKWSKSVAWFSTFKSTDKLNPYLQKIDLASLMQEFQYKNS